MKKSSTRAIAESESINGGNDLQDIEIILYLTKRKCY